jgi:hypothetical protein
MALMSFRVENQNSIRLAEATFVPRIIVIAGPNGIGNLIDALNKALGPGLFQWVDDNAQQYAQSRYPGC